MKTNLSVKEIVLWTGMLLVTIAAFFCTYYYTVSSPIKVMIWIGWLVSIFVIGFFTNKGQQVFAFAQEAKIELQKVVWPTRQETVQTTSIVMIMVAATGFILWGIDSIMMWAIAKITHLG
ncbi:MULTISPECIES: preprotein translocase subunit SecE [Legionella]|uniref:Protein translocase subunit SecE n=2 Tax=Legionella quinlivanii TaxID=45073 RepID=A0A364LGA9_9GAMM|nr:MULTISPECIES: preprotein translocase subunit SecE [Legionella]MCE3044575.1 preprotein translocase subunit SecE [Legionella sp. 16cNR16C]MCW8452034.1 preprotein translocase subunit SecE [Legionella quinlivanii]RAP35190.1 preprotein translocase subunit SecE [Legionella quinlivanii]